MSEKAPLIGVSGQIGAGKLTLVDGLARHLSLEPLFEREAANPYLAQFYCDPTLWAFRSLLFFYEQSLADAVRVQRESTGAVQDRVPEEHIEVFGREFHAKGFLSDDDIEVFERLEQSIASLLTPPDLLVYLDIDPQTALARLNSRARASEAEVSLEYLEAIDSRYGQFLSAWRVCPVLRLDTRDLDFRRDDDIRHVADLVIQELSTANARALAG